jgi:hypothetical protein
MSVITFPTPPEGLVVDGIVPAGLYRTLPRAPQRWVVEGLLPASGWLNIYSPAKRGKSYAILQMALGVANGEGEWLGFPIHTQGRVVYLQFDTPRGEWGDRLDEAANAGIPLDHIYTCDKQMIPYPFNILDPIHFSWLRDRIQALHPTLVIFDTLRESFRGDENDAAIMQQVIGLLDAAIQPAAGVIVAHSRKENLNPKAGGGKGDSVVDGMRGSSYINGRMDTILCLGRSQLSYEGRSIAPGRVKLKRMPNNYWALDQSEVDQHIKAVLAEPGLTSVLARAKVLAERTGLTVEAARKRIIRG